MASENSDVTSEPASRSALTRRSQRADEMRLPRRVVIRDVTEPVTRTRGYFPVFVRAGANTCCWGHLSDRSRDWNGWATSQERFPVCSNGECCCCMVSNWTTAWVVRMPSWCFFMICRKIQFYVGGHNVVFQKTYDPLARLCHAVDHNYVVNKLNMLPVFRCWGRTRWWACAWSMTGAATCRCCRELATHEVRLGNLGLAGRLAGHCT